MDASPDAHTILLAEDEKSLRVMVAMLLKLSGFAVVEVGTAQEAIHELSCRNIQRAAGDVRGKIFLVITDVDMPGEKGYAILPVALQTGVPVLVMTGAYDQLLEEAARLGVPTPLCIAKPFTPPALLAKVRALFRSTM